MNIEEPNYNQPNAIQREKRKSFYEKNNFIISAKYKERTEKYLTLSFNGVVSEQEAKTFYKWLKRL